jgi:fumarate reductase flavoprotein subunit
MELGPRDRLSQAFWHEQQKGRTIETPHGDAVLVDIRHLGEKKINERLPMVRELAQSYAGVDPVYEPIPVRPVVHYTMGGIHTDIDAATPLPGLFAAGECACVSINGANRLGSNSLTELLVFGARAGRGAAAFAQANPVGSARAASGGAEAAQARIRELFVREGGGETVSSLRKAMNDTMESGAGIYRSEGSLQETCRVVAALRRRYDKVQLQDRSNLFNTDLIQLRSWARALGRQRSHARPSTGRSRAARISASIIRNGTIATILHSLAAYRGAEPRHQLLRCVITAIAGRRFTRTAA